MDYINLNYIIKVIFSRALRAEILRQKNLIWKFLFWETSSSSSVLYGYNFCRASDWVFALTRSLAHSLAHSLIHSFTHSICSLHALISLARLRHPLTPFAHSRYPLIPFARSLHSLAYSLI